MTHECEADEAATVDALWIGSQTAYADYFCFPAFLEALAKARALSISVVGKQAFLWSFVFNHDHAAAVSPVVDLSPCRVPPCNPGELTSVDDGDDESVRLQVNAFMAKHGRLRLKPVTEGVDSADFGELAEWHVRYDGLHSVFCGHSDKAVDGFRYAVVLIETSQGETGGFGCSSRREEKTKGRHGIEADDRKGAGCEDEEHARVVWSASGPSR